MAETATVVVIPGNTGDENSTVAADVGTMQEEIAEISEQLEEIAEAIEETAVEEIEEKSWQENLMSYLSLMQTTLTDRLEKLAELILSIQLSTEAAIVAAPLIPPVLAEELTTDIPETNSEIFEETGMEVPESGEEERPVELHVREIVKI